VDATDGIPRPSDGTEIMVSWIDQELAGCKFADKRLGKRFAVLMEQLPKGLGQTLPLACGDWAATKAAYRFLDNDRVSEQEVLAGHFQATKDRFASAKGPVLVLHDTTEFSFTRSDAAAIGRTHKVACGHKDKAGRQRMHTVCGVLMHSSLAVTTEGLPLGLAAIKLWTRKKFKGVNALKGKGADGGKHTVNTTRIPIEQKESIRWLENVRQSTANLDEASRCVHIGDRESDIYELFSECELLKTKFVFRTYVDRRSGDGEQTVIGLMQRVKAGRSLHLPAESYADQSENLERLAAVRQTLNAYVRNIKGEVVIVQSPTAGDFPYGDWYVISAFLSEPPGIGRIVKCLKPGLSISGTRPPID